MGKLHEIATNTNCDHKDVRADRSGYFLIFKRSLSGDNSNMEALTKLEEQRFDGEDWARIEQELWRND